MGGLVDISPRITRIKTDYADRCNKNPRSSVFIRVRPRLCDTLAVILSCHSPLVIGTKLGTIARCAFLIIGSAVDRVP